MTPPRGRSLCDHEGATSRGLPGRPRLSECRGRQIRGTGTRPRGEEGTRSRGKGRELCELGLGEETHLPVQEGHGFLAGDFHPPCVVALSKTDYWDLDSFVSLAGADFERSFLRVQTA